MSDFPGAAYDRWLTTPPDDPPRCDVCDSDDGVMVDDSDPEGVSYYFDCNDPDCPTNNEEE